MNLDDLGSLKFTYNDNLDRLTSVTDTTNGNESYAYDAVGNRTASHLSNTYTYQPFNRMMETESSSMLYDPNGNTASKAEGSNFWRYGWDPENRLAEAATRKQRVRYKYDALGRRVRRYTVGNRENRKFTYDGLDVVMDDDHGTITKYQNGPGIDNKLRSRTGTDVRYFLADHLGSTVGLADNTGSLTSQTDYDSFGNATNANFPTRYQFTGREFDNFTGLQFSRARWYDPKLGRFISEDPIGFNGGDINLYGYVRNQPLIYRDPNGLYPGINVLSQPTVLQAIAAATGSFAAGAGVVASSPVAIGVGGFAVGVAIGLPIGNYTANHPSNPFVNGPLNPFGTPYPGIRPLPPAITSTSTATPYCQPVTRAIPFYRTPAIPWPVSPPDRDGCAEERSACVQLCSAARFDPDMQNIWGGSEKQCLEGCISERCKRGMKF